MKKRIFIAINLPNKLKDDLSEELKNFKKNHQDQDIKWVNPENFHLSLHFLGYCEESQIKIVDSILKQEVKNIKEEIFLEIKEKGCFPSFKNARVLFFKCHQTGEENLNKIRKRIGEQLFKNNFKIDSRLWKPHITFARVKEPISLLENFQKIKSTNLKFKAHSIDLMKSDLRRTGPIYTVLKKYSF